MPVDFISIVAVIFLNYIHITSLYWAEYIVQQADDNTIINFAPR